MVFFFLYDRHFNLPLSFLPIMSVTKETVRYLYKCLVYCYFSPMIKTALMRAVLNEAKYTLMAFIGCVQHCILSTLKLPLMISRRDCSNWRKSSSFTPPETRNTASPKSNGDPWAHLRQRSGGRRHNTKVSWFHYQIVGQSAQEMPNQWSCFNSTSSITKIK